jgi:signal transduction histidine kinase
VSTISTNFERWFRSSQAMARLHPVRFDVGVACILSVISVLSNQESALYAKPKQSIGILHLLLAFALSLPFVLRRIAPFWCVIASFGLPLLAWNIPDASVSFVVGWFAIHALAGHSEGRSLKWGRVVVVLFIFGLGSTFVFSVITERTTVVGSASKVRGSILIVAVLIAYAATAWLSGWLARGREAHMQLLAQRAAELEDQRDVQARQAVQDERLRIAREVHDVVAHHVSVMGVQAGAARLMLQTDPSKAGQVISQIESSSRSAVSDLSRLVMFLRDAKSDPLGPGVADAPQPDIQQLETLFSEARQAGMELTVNVKGEPENVSASVGLCAYRIVQEALTNVRKHAGQTASTVVDLSYFVDGIEILVQNRGRIGVLNAKPGHGVVGMQERVALVGGEVEVGPIAGGYRVSAWLPTHARRADGATAPAS